MNTLTGGCLCGAIRYTVTAKPWAVSHCHCADCRRATGAPFITWMTLPVDGFAWVQGKLGVHHSTEGVTRGFCTDCGTTLSYAGDDHADEIDISAASLDDAEAVTPDDHLWSGSALSWLHMADGLPRLKQGHWGVGYPHKPKEK